MSPIDVLAALPLIVLLVLGRASRRRQLLLVAIGAVVATLAFGVLYLLPRFGPLPEDLAFVAAAILTLASWALLLYSAAQSRRGGWLVAVLVALLLTLGLPLLLPLLLGPTLHTLLPALSTVVALLLACFVPARPQAAPPAA